MKISLIAYLTQFRNLSNSEMFPLQKWVFHSIRHQFQDVHRFVPVESMRRKFRTEINANVQ